MRRKPDRAKKKKGNWLQLIIPLANRDRAIHALSTLKEDSQLSQAAQEYAEQLLARDFYYQFF